MGYRLNGCDTGSFPFYLIEGLMKEFEIKYFVETGTANGQSVREAAKRFKRCWTIELIEGRTDWDLNLLNVEWITGHSVEALSPIVNELIGEKNAMQVADQDPKYLYTVFFLDAHYSDPTPNKSKFKECYILEELEAVSPFQDSAIIIIDDARLFLGPTPAPNDPRDWPSIQQIFELLNRLYPYNKHSVRDDYIISFPDRLSEPFDEEWVSRFDIRYPNESAKLKSQAKDVFNAIKKYLE